MRTHRRQILGFIGLFLWAGTALGGELQWKQPQNGAVNNTVNDTVNGTVNDAAVIPAFCITADLNTANGAANEAANIVPVQATTPNPPLAPLPPRVIESVPMPIPMPIPVPKNNPPAGATYYPSPVHSGTRPAILPPTVPCDAQVKLKSLRDISYDIRPQNVTELPPECALDAAPYIGRHFVQTCFQWHASALCTKGAYFEDVQLERYGHTVCPILQPVISGAKFLATVPLLPYKMGVTPPCECVYTLGHYRAGSCSPYMIDPFPISIRGALFEAGAVAGVIFAVP